MRTAYFLLLVFLVPEPSLAYIDPGIGGFLWQGLIAATVGVAFQIYQFFKGKKETHGSDSNTEPEPKLD